ncbi:MAG: hypothetical protein ABIJ50_05460 [Pseudomonadota bacterium]
MQKFLMALFFILLSTGVALAEGGKVRGEIGAGSTNQDVCGPDDDCAGDPYWWE